MWPNANRTYSKPIDLLRLNRDVTWKLALAEKQRQLAKCLSRVQQKVDHCPICKDKESRLFASINCYEYSECMSCGHIYVSNPPHSDKIHNLYSGDAKNESSLQDEIYISDDIFDVRVETIATPKVAFVKNVTNIHGGKWLDIGCGVGELVHAAKNSGYQASGFESSLSECKFGRVKGLDIQCASVSKDNFASIGIDEADIISLINVLEHQLSPREFISDLAPFIKKGSWLVIEVPRHPSLSSFMNRVFPHLTVRHMYPPDHLHVFTEKSFDLLLSETNLIVEHVWLFGQDFLEVIYSLACTDPANSLKPYEDFIASSNVIQASLDSENLSDTMFVVAKKG